MQTVKMLSEESILSELKVSGTPCYQFDLDLFEARCRKVKEQIGDIPLTFSIKANPFLVERIPKTVRHVEVCSPGELSICRRRKIKPEQIIYSGVTKETWDIKEALSYGVDFLTAESLRQVQLENNAVRSLRNGGISETGTEKTACGMSETGTGKTACGMSETGTEKTACGMSETVAGIESDTNIKQKVLLRLTSGNQFGMSETDIEAVIGNAEAYSGLDFYGLHYYSGTQKKNRQIKKDLERLERFIRKLKERFGYEPKLVEYGPGASVDYFDPPYEEQDFQNFAEIVMQIQPFAEKYPLGIEMGRFLACDCGNYFTQIKDCKENNETNYLICDGGIHQLKYYGQTMAMQIPPIRLIRQDEENKQEEVDSGKNTEGMPVPQAEFKREKEACPGKNAEEKAYMICGSLCTTADILVREVMLPQVRPGDYLQFGRCGAYSVTEGSLLFLSRTMPAIYLKDHQNGLRIARDFTEAYSLNCS